MASARASGPNFQTELQTPAERDRDAVVDFALCSLQQAARGDHTAWRVSGKTDLMDSVIASVHAGGPR